MGAYLEMLGSAAWTVRALDIQGADPSQLPGRKLVAEACIVDLLAPMLASTSSIPEHLDLLARAGWCGWFTGHAEASPGVTPPDARSLSRYSSELRAMTSELLNPLLQHMILNLFQDRPGEQLDRPLNATSVKRLLCSRVPWIHRELVNALLAELSEEGWLQGSTRGFRPGPGLRTRPLPAPSSEVALAQLYQDVYPGLVSYVEQQPGAVAGVGGLIASPDRLVALGEAIDAELDAAFEAFELAGLQQPVERRVVLTLHRMVGPIEPVIQDSAALPINRSLAERERADANLEASRLGPLLAASTLSGWGDPDEALRGLKGALALHLQRTCGNLPGGLYRAAHRRHGIGSGTLASYFDGPVLVNRNNGKIRAVKEGETSRLERETLFLLSQAYPESRSERWLWEQLSERAEVVTYQEYRNLLLTLARDGFLLMLKAGTSRCYRAPRPSQTRLPQKTWDRWQNLWLWLPAMRGLSRVLRHQSPGATIGRRRWIVDREDLPRIEEQIRRAVTESVGRETERCAHLEEVDHLSQGGKRSHFILFTRQEPWLLSQMEDMWDETTR